MPSTARLTKAFARDWPAASWQTISRREGTPGAPTSRFARVRVRAAHRDMRRAEPRGEEWLPIEWPESDAAQARYRLATLPPEMPCDRLADLAKPRWRIERDDQQLTQEPGLRPDEGGGWRGFHHRATPCIAAYAFLIAERARIPLSCRRRRRSIRDAWRFPSSSIPRRRPSLPNDLSPPRSRRCAAL